MIKIKNISKIYDTRNWFDKTFNKAKPSDSHLVPALNDITFELTKGNILGLLGPNGAGKTTLVKIITGLLLPTNGQIIVGKHNPANLSNDFKRSIGLYRGEVKVLDDGIIVKDSLAERAKIFGVDIYENKEINKIVEILDVKELFEKVPESLSQGQRTLVEFFAAIIHLPKYIILDEPTNGLDILAIQKFTEVLNYLSKKLNRTIIITSHNINNVIKLSDELLLINKGKIVLSGTVNEILKKENDYKILKVELEESVNDVKFEDLDVVVLENNFPSITFRVKSELLVKLMKQVLDKYQVKDLTVLEPPIEEIFSKYYAK